MVRLAHDFVDMLDCLERQGVEFIVVGAFAMAHFGYVRATGDIDILVASTEANSPRVVKALRTFGAPLFGISSDYFATAGNFLQLGVPPNRIDIMTRIDGVEFREAFDSHEVGKIAGRETPVLSLELLIRNKESTGRDKDLPDALELRKILTSRSV